MKVTINAMWLPEPPEEPVRKRKTKNHLALIKKCEAIEDYQKRLDAWLDGVDD